MSGVEVEVRAATGADGAAKSETLDGKPVDVVRLVRAG